MIKKTVKTEIESSVPKNEMHKISASHSSFTWICSNCSAENTQKRSSSGIHNCIECGTEVKEEK
jgi:ribosomal protein L37AE/L43A